jgi:hypothetical protein
MDGKYEIMEEADYSSMNREASLTAGEDQHERRPVFSIERA